MADLMAENEVAAPMEQQMTKWNGQERRSQNKSDWHQAKLTMIGVIVGLTIQFGTVIWWASSISVGLSLVRDSVKPLPANISSLHERVIALEIKTSEQGRALDRFNGTLDKLDDTLRKVQIEISKDSK